MFHSQEVKVDNSSLTGESEPVELCDHNTSQNPMESRNVAFNGSLVVQGEAFGIVIRTGDRTMIGQIAGLTANESKRKKSAFQRN